MLYIACFIILYVSVLFLNIFVFIIYEGELRNFFILSNFIEPLIPSALTMLLGMFLGRVTNSRRKKDE